MNAVKIIIRRISFLKFGRKPPCRSTKPVLIYRLTFYSKMHAVERKTPLSSPYPTETAILLDHLNPKSSDRFQQYQSCQCSVPL